MTPVPMVPFGQVVENRDALRVPLKKSDREQRDGPYPYYGASGVIDNIDEFIFEGPHLLIGEDGANLLARSTPIAFMADGKFWVNNHAHVLRATDKADLKYLTYFFETLDLEPYVTGTAQPKLTRRNLDRILVPLPPLPEQRRIAAILDKADSIRRKRQETIRLTEEFLRSAFLDMFGDPVTNPKGWPRTAVEVFASAEKNAMAIGPFGSNLKVSDYRTSGYPVIFVRDIRETGFAWVSNVFVDNEKFSELRGHHVAPGDVVATKMGLPPCIAGVVPPTLPQAIITADVIKLSVDRSKHVPEFVAAALNSNHCRRQVALITAGVTRPKVTLRDFRQLQLPCPPLFMQHRWKKVVEYTGLLRTHFQDADKATSLLFSSLVQRAFRGQV